MQPPATHGSASTPRSARIGAAGQAIDSGRRAGWRRASAAVGCAYVANTAIKLLVRRRRPEIPGLPALTGTPTGLSFPSAHTATGFAGALAYSRMGVPADPLYALAVTLSLSRLYLRRALPSDLIAGALLGTAVAAPPSPGPRMSTRIGIVGMPNAGKSSLFNALTKAGAEAANYPFTTIEPNVAVVPVRDVRLEQVAETVGRPRSSGTRSTSTTSPGSSRARKGEGLGNRFLANIRETDAIVHVVRSHGDANVIHPEGSVDPLRDIETIETELIFADLEQAERRLDRVAKQAKAAIESRSPRRRGCAR